MSPSPVPPQDFRRVLSSTSPVRESSAACVESSDVIPRPITRRPPEDPEALRELLERGELEALRAVPTFLPCDLLLLPELFALLLELPLPPLALIPPLLRFGMFILG